MLREAHVDDIPALHVVRMAVKENILSNPLLVTPADYTKYLTTDGKGWLVEQDNVVAGFAIIDLPSNNVWALFVHPEYEKLGVGSQLHEAMLNWYFSITNETLWLSTSPQTRAAEFYRRKGWNELGLLTNGEIKFEMSLQQWQAVRTGL